MDSLLIQILDGASWYKLVILDILEAEVGMSQVQGQPEQLCRN